MDHHILLFGSSILVKKPRCTDRFTREVIEIELHPKNINREDNFYLSMS
jgi:hypothetical protein